MVGGPPPVGMLAPGPPPLLLSPRAALPCTRCVALAARVCTGTLLWLLAGAWARPIVAPPSPGLATGPSLGSLSAWGLVAALVLCRLQPSGGPPVALAVMLNGRPLLAARWGMWRRSHGVSGGVSWRLLARRVTGGSATRWLVPYWCVLLRGGVGRRWALACGPPLAAALAATASASAPAAPLGGGAPPPAAP